MAAEESHGPGSTSAPRQWAALQLSAPQLHRLSRHIRALSELTWKLKAVREGGQHASTGCLAGPELRDSVKPKKAMRPRSRAARKPKEASARKPRAASVTKPKAGPKKRRREEEESEDEEASDASDSEPEEEELDIHTDADDTDSSGAEAEPDSEPEAKQQKAKPGRNTGRRKPKAGKRAKQRSSDDDEDSELEVGVEPETATDSKPAELTILRPVPYMPTEQELCDVCGGSEGWDGNAILLCDGPGCAVALHQHCCGAAKIPEGDWLCDGCAAKLSPEEHRCLLCPVPGGALRRVAGTGPVKLPAGSSLDEAWAHLACSVWTPEVYFEQAASLQGMRLDKLTAERVQLPCGICKQGGGAVVQCCFGKCTRAFHILCARQRGNVMALRAADSVLLCFCEMHSKQRFERTRGQLIAEAPEGMADEHTSPNEAPPAQPNEYEAQRERNILRNKLRLAKIESMKLG